MTSSSYSADANRKIFRLFMLALALMLGIILLAVINMFSVRASNERRARSVDNLLLLENLYSTLLQAEASQRAYILTDDIVFEQEFTVYAAQMDELLARLGEGAAYRTLIASARARLAGLQSVLDIYHAEGFAAAQALVQNRSGKALMDRYREQNAIVETAETNFLLDARRETDTGSQRLLYLLAAWVLVNLVLLGLGGRVLRRDQKWLGTMVAELQLGSEEIVLLNDLNASLLSCTDHKEATRVIEHYLRRLFPDVAGVLYLYRASRNVLELQGTWGQVGGTVPERLLSEECWSLRRGAPHQWRSPADLPCAHYSSDAAGHPSICLPMMALGETLGLLYVQGIASVEDQPGFFSDTRMRLLQTTASQIASSIANLNLRAALHSQSIRDPLTGLYNRRYLEETMQREEMRAKRSGQPLSIVMADIDHFKQYNDTQGHQAGDSLLQAFGEALAQVVRDEDIACRYGGEEFMLILPGASLERAVERAEQARAAVARLRVRQGGRPLPDVTASFGVACFPAQGDHWQDVLRKADAALYQAKRDGRNRTVAAGGDAA
jgi:diguanylate cyclase (GGDEF)-like protein